jgi:hypothetical protein
MFDVVLFEPEIPPNTGNIIRLCANTGARLHLMNRSGSNWTTGCCGGPGWIITSGLRSNCIAIWPRFLPRSDRRACSL